MNMRVWLLVIIQKKREENMNGKTKWVS